MRKYLLRNFILHIILAVQNYHITEAFLPSYLNDILFVLIDGSKSGILPVTSGVWQESTLLNKLQLNLDKCCKILFTRNISPTTSNLYLFKESLNGTNLVKDLVVLWNINLFLVHTSIILSRGV